MVFSACRGHTNFTVCVQDFKALNPSNWSAECSNPKQGKFTLDAAALDGFVSMPFDDARAYILSCESAKKELIECEKRCQR
jgi:hypothetical protein